MNETRPPRTMLRRTMLRRTLLRRIGAGFVCLVVAIVCLGTYMMRHIEGQSVGSVPKTVTSRDGTVIAYEQTGAGPVVILVSAALADRGGTTRLANHLAQRFTVINYDRRGRGKSTDTQPYAVQHEVEDIAALIDASGGSAFVFGSSSGSVLALDAASRLGGKIRKLFLYEPPFIVDDSRPPLAPDLAERITELVSAGRRNEAVTLFFGKGMGIPNFAVTLMRLVMPGWSKMAGMAHTIPYDLAILAGTQAGQPLPAQRWSSATAPTLVMVGSRSEPFFHNGAKALAETLADARYGCLEGRDHSVVLLASQAMATEVTKFFLAR